MRGALSALIGFAATVAIVLALLACAHLALGAVPYSRFLAMPSEELARAQLHLDDAAVRRGPAADAPPDIVFLATGNASGPDSTVHRFIEGTDWLAARRISAQEIRIRLPAATLAAIIEGLAAIPAVANAPAESVRGAEVRISLRSGEGDSAAVFLGLLDYDAARACIAGIKAAASGRTDLGRLLDAWACELGLAPLSAATDVTGSLSVESSVLRREKTGIVDVKVRIINNSEEMISGPLTLVIGSDVGAFLANPDGATCTARPAGRPYVTIPAPRGLAPWNSVGAVLRFKNPPSGPIDLKARVFSGSAAP